MPKKKINEYIEQNKFDEIVEQLNEELIEIKNEVSSIRKQGFDTKIIEELKASK